MEPDVDAQFERNITVVCSPQSQIARRSLERLILGYWGLSLILGGVFLYDWLTVWNVTTTLAQPGFVAYLLGTFLLGQILYMLVARHDNRPLRFSSTLIFAVGNGFFETLAFALVYRLGEVSFAGLFNLFAPDAAPIAGLLGGVGLFMVYGGLIHALFWLRILPPHLDDSPRSRAIRKFRPVSEVALVIGWSLCFWLYRDIWTVTFLHILVDLGLMLRVRPDIFNLER